MSGKYFIDTNIFICSFDPRNRYKQKKAQEIIDQAVKTGQGMISYQVVQEFLNVALRKFSVPLSAQDCLVYLEQILRPLCEVYPTFELYKDALLIQAEIKISFYDALMVVSSIHGGCHLIYSEDLQHGLKISGLHIENPFFLRKHDAN